MYSNLNRKKRPIYILSLKQKLSYPMIPINSKLTSDLFFVHILTLFIHKFIKYII